MLLLFLIFQVRAIEITGTVIDAQGITICGAYITLYQQQKQLNQVQTKEDGTYIISTSESANLIIEATLNHNLQTPIRYPVSSNKQDFKLTLDDITVNGQAVMAKIVGQFLNGAKPLSGVQINYRIEYQDKGVQKFEFPSTSNEQGFSKLFTIYPKSSGILKFLAQSENFWNEHQEKDTDDKYILIVNNEYKSTFTVAMAEGHFTQYVIGTVVDKITNKGLGGVVVDVTFSCGSKGQLDNQKFTTKDDGKFSITYQTLLWYQFTITIKFEKQFYAQNELSKTFSMDHEDRTQTQGTWDLATVQLPVQPHVVLQGEVKDPNLKSVPALKISMIATFEDIQNKFEVTTDKDGKWEKKELLLEPQATYTLKMTYTNDEKKELFFYTSFSTNGNTQQTTTIAVLYYQKYVPATFSGHFKKPEDIQLKIPYKVNCDSIPPNLPDGFSDLEEAFDYTFKAELKGDQILNCFVTQGDTQMCQPFNYPFNLNAPDWKNDKVQINSIVYNLFKQVVNGVVKDGAGLVQFIGDAKLSFTIYQKDKINVKSRELPATSLKDNGKYEIKFPVAKSEIEYVSVKVTHIDFLEYYKEDSLKLPADKDQTWPLDITLSRIEFGQKDGVVLKYIIDTLKQKASLKMKSSKPLMPYPKIYEQNPSTADGIFKLDFICYQSIEYTATFEISIEKFTPMMFTSNPFTCKKGEQQITSDSLNLEGDFTVKFIDANNQPLSGIAATFKTDPISDELTLTSGKDGIITFIDTKLFKNQSKYIGILTYQSQPSVPINFFTATQKVIQAFPDQYVGQQVTYTISGKVKLDRGALKSSQNVHVECAGGITKDGKTELDGSFSVSFQKQSNFNDELKCTTTISGDVEKKSFDSTFSKGAYTSTNNDVITSLLDVQLSIKGQVFDPLNQPKKDLSVSLTLKYDDKESTKPLILTTNKDGQWELKDEKIKANADYTFKLTFTNAAKQTQNWEYPQKYTSSTFTIKPKDEITFPNSYFQDFEICHASGSAINPPKFVPATIPLKLTCPSISKDMKPAIGNSEFNTDLKYDIKVDPLVEYDQKLNCQLTSVNEKVAKVDKTIIFEGAKKWEIIQDLQITFVLWKIIIQGKIKDATGIEPNLKDAKVQIAVHSQTKLDYFLRTLHHKLSKTNPVDVTVKESDYSSSFQILNEELLSADIAAQHEDFIPFSLPNAVQFGNKDETKTYDIKLERIVIEATLGGTIGDSGTISVSETEPKSPEQKSPAPTVTIQKGKPFAYPFQCYQNVEYAAKFKLVNDQKQQIEYQTEQPFTCKKAVNIKIRSTNDKVELKLAGTIFDGDKIVDKVKDAKVQYEIKVQEKTVVKDTLITDENGKYSKDKIILSPDKYKIYYTVTHPQFTTEQPDYKDLDLIANQEFKQDFTLKRVVNSQKIKVSLQDATKKPLQGSSVSANSFDPKKQNDVPPTKGDSSGVATIEVQCFKGVTETYNLKIQIGDVIDEQQQTIDCDGQAQEHTISTKTQYVNVNGVIIDPYCEGKVGLEINLTSEPSSQNLNAKVQDKGKWSGEFLLKLDQQYQVMINYKDWQGNDKQEQQKYNIKQDETNLDYHKIFYEDKVDTKVSGFVDSITYHGSLKFHNIQLLDEDGDVIAHSEIDQFSEYELKSQLVARCETKYPEKVFIKASQHFEAASQDITIIPPKFIYKNIDLKAQETSAYKNEIKKFFSKFKITGSLESEYNCKDKLFRAVQHASVSIVKKQESGDKVKAATHTNDMGKFELYFFLSKKQVENNIFVWLNMEKEGFTTPFPLLIIPSQYEKFQMDEETVTEIDVGYQSMSPIKDLGCPEDVPKISSTNQLH